MVKLFVNLGQLIWGNCQTGLMALVAGYALTVQIPMAQATPIIITSRPVATDIVNWAQKGPPLTNYHPKWSILY